MNHSYGQSKRPPNRDSLFCGAPVLPEAERQALERQIKLIRQIKQASGENKVGITYVPIKPHIFRQANGVGGMTLTSLNDVLAKTNRYYLDNGNGIQFYFCGTSPDYIDSDPIYNNGFPYRSGDESSANGRDATNAMNTYFVNRFDENNLLGYAYLPKNTVQSTRLFIRTGGLSNTYIADYILTHELGHSFNLYHTFERSTGEELVTRGSGANCTFRGDLLCDTPADPYDLSDPLFSTTIVNGCEVYTGTAKDANGESYNPQMTNIMSYYEGCSPTFTAGQYDRIYGGLLARQGHSTYTLNCPPTTVAAPVNLNATPLSSGGVSLTWQSNDAQAMGYLVERSTSRGGLYVPVGGVSPNTTVFNDFSVAPFTTYWYRVRPSNSASIGISGAVAVSTGNAVCRPSFSQGCADNDGFNSVTINNVALSNNSGCSPSAYSSSTAVSPVVQAGQTVNVSATFLHPTFDEGVVIWGDLNRNGAYEPSEILYQSPSSLSRGGFTGTLTIPASTAAGQLTIRALLAYGEVPTNPCGNYTYGEAEDYVLTVQSGACSTLFTTRNGDWNDPGVWSCNRVPNANDPVELRHTVTISAATSVSARRISYAAGGKVVLNASSRLQLGQ